MKKSRKYLAGQTIKTHLHAGFGGIQSSKLSSLMDQLKARSKLLAEKIKA